MDEVIMAFEKPHALRPGDTIRIVAPGMVVDRDAFERGAAILAARYRVVFRDDIFASHRYLAGSDARRLAELEEAFLDTEAGAVFCARGGYGATRLLPRLRVGAVLCIEDVGERPYRLDRMWTHLRMAGVFDRISGIALGTFGGCDEKDGSCASSDVLADLALEVGKPCAIGFFIGHDDWNFAAPLGVRVRLDADAGRLDFLEAAVKVTRSSDTL